MLEETYLKFKKNILPKMKKMQPNLQEPVVEYCEPEQVIYICLYNHYPILDKSSQKQGNSNDDNDIYDTSELEHEFEYGIYEDVLKTEQLMAELKRIVEAENENKKSRDVHFGYFPLEQFSDAGKVANEGDPQLKAAADTELYEIEKRAIQIDTEKYEYDNSSGRTDDTNSSQRAENDYSSQRADDYYSQSSAFPLIADIKMQPYSMLTYLDNGMMTGTYDNTHNIPIYIDNGSTLNIMPMHFYDNAYYLHHFLKAPTAAKTILTGNGPVKTHFWIDVILNVQGCMIQLKLLVCDTQAQTGILLSKMALEQLQTWQDYSNNTLYVKQTAIPLHAIQNIELLPDRKTTIELIADKTNELQYKDIIGGQGIVWVWSNDSSKPLQPIVATFHNDKTLITFENTTGQTQYVSKGALVAILDMRSKDGGMTNFEWDIPIDDEGNLVLYAHTFASSLEPTKLANEDPALQAETKIAVSQTPNNHTVKTENTDDPYPWLDVDDPRRKMTDEEILRLKVPFNKSILTAAEKERLIKLMLENTAAFSIRDEIGTCPYFEVKLKLRDDKPFFVRPYNICEDQKPIIQKEMDRLEKLGII